MPLLDETLQQVKSVLDKALPLGKKRTALEEAEFEDDEPEGALEREILMQSKQHHATYHYISLPLIQKWINSESIDQESCCMVSRAWASLTLELQHCTISRAATYKHLTLAH